MNILTIDTVLNKTYFSLLINGIEIFKTIESDENNYHSAYLIKELNDTLKENNASLSDIDFLGVNTGVGSFTGIRVNLAIAKIISNRLNLKVVPINTFEVLKKAYKNENVMLDARRGSVFYSENDNEIEMISYDAAKEILKNSEYEVICDNSFKKRFEEFSNRLVSYEEKGLDLAKSELEIVKEKIEKNEITDTYGLRPTYIQTPPIFSKG